MKRSVSVMNKVNLLQAGGRKLRGPGDQTFILRSLINHAIYIGKSIVITCYDYKQCFDKLWLQEGILSLVRLGLPAEYAKLIYKLNETSLISVKTPFGYTERFSSKDISKQGTVIGPSLCSASLGEVIDDLEGGVAVGDLNIPAILFVDDLNSTQTDIRRVHSSHESIILFSKKKNQPLNKEKCCILTINKQPGGVCPILMIDDHQLEEVEKVKYVGDVFNNKGNNKDLIKDRVSKGVVCIRTCIAECADVTLGVHAIRVLLVMYKSIFLHTVLFDSGPWCNLTQGNKDSLTGIQMKYLRRILHVPSSTPSLALLRELGVIPIINEIECRQLCYLQHILSLEKDDPVRQLYDQQKKYKFAKTWYREIEFLFEKYGMELDEEKIQEMGKWPWKSYVQKKVNEYIIAEMNEKVKGGSKTKDFPILQQIHTEKYLLEMQPADARLLFRVRSKMVKLRAVCHYMNDDTTCRLCGDHEETIHHVLNECRGIDRKDESNITTTNIYGNDVTTCKDTVERIKTFLKFASERESEESQQDSVIKEGSDVICIPVH